MEIVILAGGLGTRVRSVFSGPKALIPVHGKPIVAHVIDWCLALDLGRITVAAGYRGNEVQQVIGERYGDGVDVHLEPELRGTAGCLLPLLPRLGKHFLVVNGDTLVEGDLRSLWRHHVASGAMATIGVVRSERLDAGHIETQGPLPSTVVQFQEKTPEESHWISAGVYALSREALMGTGKLPLSLEHDVFPELAHSQELQAYPLTRSYDIGTPDRLKEVEHQWWEIRP